MGMPRPARSAAAREPAHTLAGDDTPGEHLRWHDLVSQIGAEVAAPLTAALERINALTSTGRIDRAALRALRDEVEAARQAGMIGQQLTRFASGRLRQSHERLQLADMLHGVIAHRSRATSARGLAVRPVLNPVEVIVDASLLFGLLNATVDWALANAQSQIDFAIDLKTWPAHAVLTCRFAHRPADEPADDGAAPRLANLDSLTWRLLEQTAWTMGLLVERRDEAHKTVLTLEFPRTASSVVEGVSTLELNDGFAPSANSQPLAGSHVLVISPRRELRVQIRESLRHMSMIIDFVNSVDEAAAFCAEGLPHAVIVESALAGDRFQKLRAEIAAEFPDFVFIEVVDQGRRYEMAGTAGTAIARIGRDAIAASLPSALMYELSKSL